MTEVNTTTAAEAPAKAPRVKTVIEDMDSRVIFDSHEAAMNYLQKCQADYADFDNHPLVANGLVAAEDGTISFDPAVYTESMRVMIAVLANRGEKVAPGKPAKPSTVKAIVITPVPSIPAILADPQGQLWMARILEKEMNHVAVRNLRTAADELALEEAQAAMPLTLADYTTSSRESSGGILETFNLLFKGLIASLAEKSKIWAKRKLTKAEFKKASESSAYALEYYNELEDRGDKQSMFVMAIKLGQREAAKQGLDPAIFDRWLATRDQKALAEEAAAEDEDFDLDDLAFEAADAGDAGGNDSAASGTPTEEVPQG